MVTITQRELRDASGRVLREVERGGEFTITRRGVPVARLVPLEAEPTGCRPARREPRFSVAELVSSNVSSEQLLADLRGNR
jgi:prevent-host-death family protein